MFSPAKILPKRRKLSEIGRNRIEKISRKPTAKKMRPQQLQAAGGFALGPEQMRQKAARAIGLHRPDHPAGEEDHRHGEGHVQVGVAAAQQRSVDVESVRGLMPQPIVPTPGISPNQLANRMKMKMRGEEPKRLLHQFGPDDAFKKVVQAFDHPFPEILRPLRDELHLAGRRSGRK